MKKPLKITITVTVLVAIIAYIVFMSNRSKDNQDKAAIYAELKALPVVSKDFTTPEGAILCLEDAYRHHDLEAAVACKDFSVEAKLMIQELVMSKHMDTNLAAYASLIKETTDDLEQTYRKDTLKSWPDFTNLESFFTKREPYAENVVVVTEVCHFPDGLFSNQRLVVAQTSNGWRVLNPILK